MPWTKGVAITGFTFGMIHKVTGEGITSGVVTGYRTINGGTQTALAGTPVHEGNGQWSVDLSAAEMDGEVIGLTFTHASAVSTYATIRTSGGGINQVTITINDGTDPLPDVDVHVYNSDNTVFMHTDTTTSLGVATFTLNDGTYKVRLQKVGVSFTVPETLTVSGDTTGTYSGTVVSIGAPVDSDVCRVYEYCFDQDGATPLASVSAKASIKKYPYDYDTKLHAIEAVDGTYNATTGLVYWDIVRESTVLFVIKELGVNERKVIPDAATGRLSDLD